MRPEATPVAKAWSADWDISSSKGSQSAASVARKVWKINGIGGGGEYFWLEYSMLEVYKATDSGRAASMRIACVGAGPGGLYFAITMKLRDPAHEVVVFKRNRPGD